MDSQMMNDISQIMSEQSRMLSRKAMRNLKKMDKTNVTCPKCGTVPKMTVTPKHERITISCRCGYVFDAEINF